MPASSRFLAPRQRPSAAAALLLGGLGLLLGGCSEGPSGGDAPEADAAEAAESFEDFEWPEGPHPVAVLEVDSLGAIHIELFPELAPENVALFRKLADLRYYDGTTFHRVIPEFMIQGGDPNTKDEDPKNDGTGSSGFAAADEFDALPPVRGVVGMANRGRPRTGSGQFFILQRDAPHLAGRYSLFGRVVEGIEVVDRVMEVPRDETGRWGPKDRPLEDVVVSSVRLRE